MHQLYKDEALRARLIQNAPAQVAKFNWQSSADKLWDCMMRCVEK
jgi:hypothetical protein